MSELPSSEAITSTEGLPVVTFDLNEAHLANLNDFIGITRRTLSAVSSLDLDPDPLLFRKINISSRSKRAFNTLKINLDEDLSILTRVANQLAIHPTL